ncbi:MAG: hypothetical protein NVS4B13_09660 [Candidatus Elarobacter sp.]
MWFDTNMMAEHHSPLFEEPSPPEIKRAALATVTLVALFSFFAFAPPRDPTKVVAGVPCSVLSEEDISAVLGTQMRLMPTTGTVCHYVSTGAGASRALFVIARHDASMPKATAGDSAEVSGVGDAAMLSSNALYVRYGSRSYTFDVVPQSPDDARVGTQELRLAKMARRPAIAQNR